MTDVFSWGESSPEEQFDEDDSWISEPESSCNNWRGWKKTTPTTTTSNQNSFGLGTSQQQSVPVRNGSGNSGNHLNANSGSYYRCRNGVSGSSTAGTPSTSSTTRAHHASSTINQRSHNLTNESWPLDPNCFANGERNQQQSSNFDLALPGDQVPSLTELAARVVAYHISFEVVESVCSPVPEQLQLRIAYWSFPDNEEDIRLYSCLANGSADEFQKGENLYRCCSVKCLLQIGFHLSASVVSPPAKVCTVALTFDRCRITSCNCTCTSSSSWCSHVVAVCLHRIYQPDTVLLRAPFSESLSRLSRDQLQKFAQHLISKSPQQLLPTAQLLLDDLLLNEHSSINRVRGAPDPTAGAPATVQTKWCLDELQLHGNIRKIVIKLCIPSPMVYSDVNYLSSAAPPAAAEWSSLLRPLRGREPEGLWNLLSIVREMLRRHDRNAIPLLRILTEELLSCDQILQWWFSTNLSLLRGYSTSVILNPDGSSNGSGSNNRSMHSNISASKHACGSLCDEIVNLWRLVTLNPAHSPADTQALFKQFKEYHLQVLSSVHTLRPTSSVAIVYENNGTGNNQNRTLSGPYSTQKLSGLEIFSGFKPAMASCLINWDDYPIPGITYQRGNRSGGRSYYERQTMVHDQLKNTSPNITNHAITSTMVSLRMNSELNNWTDKINNFSNNITNHLNFSSFVDDDEQQEQPTNDDDEDDDEQSNSQHRANFNSDTVRKRNKSNATKEKDSVSVAESETITSNVTNTPNDDCQKPSTSNNQNNPIDQKEKDNESEDSGNQDYWDAQRWNEDLSASDDESQRKNNNKINKNRDLDPGPSSSSSSIQQEIANQNNDSPQDQQQQNHQQEEIYQIYVYNNNNEMYKIQGDDFFSSQYDYNKILLLASKVKPIEDPFEILFTRAEALYAHGYVAEACRLSVQLAEQLLNNPPDLQIQENNAIANQNDSQASTSTAVSNNTSTSNNQQRSSHNKRINRNRFNPALHQISLQTSAILSKAAFLCQVLTENEDSHLLAFRVGLFGLELVRPPASTKALEVKLAHQEQELVNMLKRIPLRPQALSVLREKAEHLRDGRLTTRGEALLPLSLASYIFEALALSVQVQPEHLLPTDERLVFDAVVAAIGLKAKVSEAEHPLLCEGTRRQRGDLALNLLVHYKDSKKRLDLIMEKLLDQEIHPIFNGGKKSHGMFSQHQVYQTSSPASVPTHPSQTSLSSEKSVNKNETNSESEPNGQDSKTDSSANKTDGNDWNNLGNEFQSNLCVSSNFNSAEISNEPNVENKDNPMKQRRSIFHKQGKTNSGSECSSTNSSRSSGSSSGGESSDSIMAMEQKQSTSAIDDTSSNVGQNDVTVPTSDSVSESPNVVNANSDNMDSRSQSYGRVFMSTPYSHIGYDHPILQDYLISKQMFANPLAFKNGKPYTSRQMTQNLAKLQMATGYISAPSLFSSNQSPMMNMPAGVGRYSNYKPMRYKGKRHYPVIPNQPSEASAHFMFELAKTLLAKAGGNNTTVLFTQPPQSQNCRPHRLLHMCAFQIGLYALGLHNAVSRNWLLRTYSSHVSWITMQAMEIGHQAIEFLIDSWEGHLTPSEVASLADRASRNLEPMMVKAAAELALSCLPHAHALTPSEIQRALIQCREQNTQMLERACLAVEQAAQGGGVYPEVLFDIARKWYDLFQTEKNKELQENGANQTTASVENGADSSSGTDSSNNKITPEVDMMNQFSKDTFYNNQDRSTNYSGFSSFDPIGQTPYQYGMTSPSYPIDPTTLPVCAPLSQYQMMLPGGPGPANMSSAYSGQDQSTNALYPYFQYSLPTQAQQQQQQRTSTSSANSNSKSSSYPQRPYNINGNNKNQPVQGKQYPFPAYGSPSGTHQHHRPAGPHQTSGAYSNTTAGNNTVLYPQSVYQQAQSHHHHSQSPIRYTLSHQYAQFYPPSHPILTTMPITGATIPPASNTPITTSAQTGGSNSVVTSATAACGTGGQFQMNGLYYYSMNGPSNAQPMNQMYGSVGSTTPYSFMAPLIRAQLGFGPPPPSLPQSLVTASPQGPTFRLIMDPMNQHMVPANQSNGASVCNHHQATGGNHPQTTNQHPTNRQSSQSMLGQRHFGYIHAAYRVGILAMETLARRTHDDRPQARYARNPSYGEDVKWLLFIAKQLGSQYVQEFCLCTLTAVASPFVLYDIIIDAADSILQSTPTNQAYIQTIRPQILNPLIQKCQEKFISCIYFQIIHITSSDYDEFISTLRTARAAFRMTPGGQIQFNDLLQSLKRTKTCKKELWQQITNAMQNE